MDVPYSGSQKLVMCLDVGTTQSGVSLMHLQPGVLPKVRVVNRWPGDANSAKIPSLVLYDSRGVAKSFGAEALLEHVQVQANEEGWHEAKWFKLHLHPKSMDPPPYSCDTGSSMAQTFEVPPLPKGVAVSQVYEDWFGYLLRSTKVWFEENSPDGDVIWQKLASTMVFVVAHPNGWETAQQATLSSALQKAVRIAKPSEQIVFVTEAEASVHFSLQYCGNKDWLKVGAQFAVVDAGGSTVDTCVYEVEKTEPKLKLKEAKTSDCVQAGAIFPTRQARTLLADKFKSSPFGSAEFLDRIVQEWDVKTKHRFAGLDDGNHLIKFGYERDTDKSCSISRGRLTLTPAEVEKAFLPSIERILQSVDSQVSNTKTRHILLTGGFGESPYLQNRLREKHRTRGIHLLHADEPSKKAVAEGAALFYVRNTVTARAAHFDYGIGIGYPASTHVAQAGSRPVYTSPSGKRLISGGWSRIVTKGQIIGANEMISNDYWLDVKVGDSLVSSDRIYLCRDTERAAGTWLTDKNGDRLYNFEACVTVEADLSSLATAANLRTNQKTGAQYYRLHYQIGIFFGGVSLAACCMWTENGVERRGEASIIPSTNV
ncbi:hypothetical protein JCM5296_006567 [Sporobolomyces johnsonii]